jgi:hypothetical protein
MSIILCGNWLLLTANESLAEEADDVFSADRGGSAPGVTGVLNIPPENPIWDP